MAGSRVTATIHASPARDVDLDPQRAVDVARREDAPAPASEASDLDSDDEGAMHQRRYASSDWASTLERLLLAKAPSRWEEERGSKGRLWTQSERLAAADKDRIAAAIDAKLLRGAASVSANGPHSQRLENFDQYNTASLRAALSDTGTILDM